jgi:hypothetical protein
VYDRSQQAENRLIFGLRTTEGVSVSELEAQGYNDWVQRVLMPWIEKHNEFLCFDKSTKMLSLKTMHYSCMNTLLSKLMQS